MIEGWSRAIKIPQDPSANSRRENRSPKTRLREQDQPTSSARSRHLNFDFPAFTGDRSRKRWLVKTVSAPHLEQEKTLYRFRSADQFWSRKNSS
jgi:hypothetical protein